MTIAELFSTRKQWIRGYYAAVKHAGGLHYKCRVDSTEAQCWCLSGAVMKCYPKPAQQRRVYNKLRKAIDKLGWHRAIPGSRATCVVDEVKEEENEGVVVRFNDSHYTSFRQIKAVVDLAKV